MLNKLFYKNLILTDRFDEKKKKLKKKTQLSRFESFKCVLKHNRRVIKGY